MITQEISMSYDKDILNWLSGVLVPDEQFRASRVKLYDLLNNYLDEMKTMYKKVHHLRLTQEGWESLEKGYSLCDSNKYLEFLFNQMIDPDDYLMLCLLGKNGLSDEEVFSARSGEDCINLCLVKKPLIKQKLTKTGVPVKIKTL